MNENSRKFHSTDEMAVDENYRPISVMSIFAMIFAVLSLPSILVPAMLTLAIVGVGLGVMALIRIWRHGGKLAGGALAGVAICISLFMFALTLSYHLSIADYHKRLAIRNAQDWINLLQEADYPTAYLLTRPPRLRGVTQKGSGQLLPEADLDSFRSQPLMRALKGVPQEIEFVGLQKKESFQDSSFWVLQFELPDQLGNRPFNVNMRRKYDTTSKSANWIVTKFEFVD